MTATAIIAARPSVPSSPFLRSLRVALGSAMHHETQTTMKVGVMQAAGLSRTEMLRTLQAEQPDIDDIDIRAALQRLKRVGELWKG